jgi:hypothetical protein
MPADWDVELGGRRNAAKDGEYSLRQVERHQLAETCQPSSASNCSRQSGVILVTALSADLLKNLGRRNALTGRVEVNLSPTFYTCSNARSSCLSRGLVMVTVVLQIGGLLSVVGRALLSPGHQFLGAQAVGSHVGNGNRNSVLRSSHSDAIELEMPLVAALFSGGPTRRLSMRWENWCGSQRCYAIIAGGISRS